MQKDPSIKLDADFECRIIPVDNTELKKRSWTNQEWKIIKQWETHMKKNFFESIGKDCFLWFLDETLGF